MSADLEKWDVEDENFWEETGKKIANRNLLISIICLLLGFCVWMYWSVITVQMVNLGFHFTQLQLTSLVAIGGFTGATLRIPSTFFVRIAGGRNTIFLTTFFLIIPALGAGIGLMNPNTPLWQFQVFALLGGIGGGNFSSSMSNISFFYPKKVQGYSLGMNAGLGNFGVTTMQVLVPLVLGIGVIGHSLALQQTSGSIIGKLAQGTEVYVQNGALVWVALLVPMCAAAWFGMNNIVTENVSPNLGSTASSFAKIIGMTLIGLITSAIGIMFILPKANNGFFEGGCSWVYVLPIVVIVTVGVLRILPGGIGESLNKQYAIFKNPHTWSLTIIYTMAFGSFIGFAGAFGLSIKFVFGFIHTLNPDGSITAVINPNAPSALSYAWLGAFIGALIRPVGGMLADKIGGSKVTAVMTVLMIICCLGAGHYMQVAYYSPTPETYFMPFFILFLVLFFATGVANGSIFRTGAVIFLGPQKGPLLGWIAAIAAYGAFIIPKVIGPQIKAGTPSHAMIGLAIFYAVCLVIIIACYLRPGVKYRNA